MVPACKVPGHERDISQFTLAGRIGEPNISPSNIKFVAHQISFSYRHKYEASSEVEHSQKHKLTLRIIASDRARS